MGFTQKLVDYIIEKKQTVKNDELKEPKKMGLELRALMQREGTERLVAVFLEDYMPETYTIIPCEKMLSLSFGYNDDLDMVGEMLINCAKLKHEERIRNSFVLSKVEERPYSVMLYDEKSKKLAGGLTVYQEKPERVVNIIGESERQKRIQTMKDNNVM